MDWFLRSGGARGADDAFQKGAPSHLREIFLASNNLPQEAIQIAEAHHNGWDFLTPYGQMLMTRNVLIILGSKLDRPSDMVLHSKLPSKVNIDTKGGTNHALRVARTYGIPTFNVNIPADQEAINKIVFG